MRLPPEGWADEITGLHGQLIQCMEELIEREDELRDATDDIARLERRMGDMTAQQTLLYVDENSEKSETGRRGEGGRGRERVSWCMCVCVCVASSESWQVSMV